MITNLKEFLNEGKISYKQIFKNPYFIKKFKGSKVVDSNGEPLLMYHGGSYSGGEFKGAGWFTVSKTDAKYYAKQNHGQVTSAFLIIKNPLFSGDIKHLNIKITPEILKSSEKRDYNITIKNDIIQYIETNVALLIAQDIGCDGVISIHEKEILDAIIFSNDQLLLPEKYISTNEKFDSFNIEKYEHGRCELFSLALHKELGYDMYFYLDEEAEFNDKNNFEYGMALVHAYATDKNNNKFDTSGLITEKDIEDNHADYVNSPLTLYVSDEKFQEFIKNSFIENYTEYELNECRKFIRENIFKYKI